MFHTVSDDDQGDEAAEGHEPGEHLQDYAQRFDSMRPLEIVHARSVGRTAQRARVRHGAFRGKNPGELADKVF
jgi:hypothetical protein